MGSKGGSDRFVAWAGATVRNGAWAPAVVFGVHLLLMSGFDAYRRLPQLDVFMHFVGGVAVGSFLDRASRNGSRFGLLGTFHRGTHVILVASLVCVVAVAWEAAEFLIDRGFGTRHQPGLDDTMADLLLGNAGGTAFLVATGLLRRAGRDAARAYGDRS